MRIIVVVVVAVAVVVVGSIITLTIIIVDPIDFDKSLLISSSSVVDNSFDEMSEALISPLFLEHNFKKLSEIFFTKKNPFHYNHICLNWAAF